MKKSIRFAGLFLYLVVILTVFIQVSASAADAGAIDVSNASSGYFTVYYAETASRMKVGVTVNGNTSFADYTPGTAAAYSFSEGSGQYKIGLYLNIGGTSYQCVSSTEVNVTLASENAQYLVSTSEISFPAGGAVAQKANELCSGKETVEAKIVAIYNSMLGFSYDYALADMITRGEIVGYTPDTASVLQAGKGICYDFSALFAAMCRSQGIPCKLVKGTCNNVYHAWNEVFCNGVWYRIDMTYAAQNSASAASLAECVSWLSGYAA